MLKYFVTQASLLAIAPKGAGLQGKLGPARGKLIPSGIEQG